MMRLFQHNKPMKFTIFTLIILLLTACQSVRLDQSPTPFTNTASEATKTFDEATMVNLNSLEKIDDYPFYVMHYSGGYDYTQIGDLWRVKADFSCSLFASLGDMSEMLYGRNFDWEFSPTLLLFTDPPDGYASASMVDLTFLGLSPETANELLNLPLEQRIDLLAAPSMPFDGLNEYGLAVGMAALPDSYLDDASYDPSRHNIGSIGIIRQVLDHARNVDEALEIFEQYNIDFSGGPPIHYLLADSRGEALLIEFYQGEMVVLPNETPWHLATNHLRFNTQGDGGCWRYHAISERLTSLDGQLDEQAAMQILSQVKQAITQWSVVYDMSNGDIHVAMGGDYQTNFIFHLDLQKP
jgi:hypothetical protein